VAKKRLEPAAHKQPVSLSPVRLEAALLHHPEFSAAMSAMKQARYASNHYRKPGFYGKLILMMCAFSSAPV